MLAQLEMKLEVEQGKKVNYNMSSLLQGVLMENISQEYCEILHKDGVHPYIQCLEINREDVAWIVNTETKEAFEKIIIPLMMLQEFTLKQKEITIKILERHLRQKSYEELIKQYYFQDGGRIMTIHFRTATSFKSAGEYIFYPSIRHIYQSIIHKHNTFMTDKEIAAEGLLDDLVDHTKVISYNIKSINFFMESVKIPGFIGQIKIRITGPGTMVNLIHFLLAYGEHCGVGIKCGMGMGHIVVEHE